MTTSLRPPRTCAPRRRRQRRQLDCDKATRWPSTAASHVPSAKTTGVTATGPPTHAVPAARAPSDDYDKGRGGTPSWLPRAIRALTGDDCSDSGGVTHPRSAVRVPDGGGGVCDGGHSAAAAASPAHPRRRRRRQRRSCPPT